MSYWGATVITNLFSAIPWIGPDQVELKPFDLITAEIYNNCYISLPIFGIINKKANQKIRSYKEKAYAQYIEKSFLAKFLGFIDGDGYIKITKTPKGYIRLGLVLNLHSSEISMLQDFSNILKIGRINIYPKLNIVQYNISRTDQQEILIPLIKYHNLCFLTYTRRKQFEKLIYILENNILKFDKIPTIIPKSTESTINSSSFIFNWLIGFTMAEGSFNIKKDGSFNYSLKQRNENLELFEQIAQIFETKTKIKDFKGHLQLNLSSKKDISNVVHFFSNKNIENLRGNKLIQYKLWIKEKKLSTRYKDRVIF